MFYDTIPEYILSTGVLAQQTRRRRPSLASITSNTSIITPRSDPEIAHHHQVESIDEDIPPESSADIKMVVGYFNTPHRGWSLRRHTDKPRLIRL